MVIRLPQSSSDGLRVTGNVGSFIQVVRTAPPVSVTKDLRMEKASLDAIASKCTVEGMVLFGQHFKDGLMVVVMKVIGPPWFHFNPFEFLQANDNELNSLVENSIALSDAIRMTIASNDAVGKGIDFCDRVVEPDDRAVCPHR